MLNDLVWIKTWPDEAAAARVRELLRSMGIESVVAQDPGRELYQRMPPVRGFRLGVHADDVRAALDVLWTREGAKRA